MTISDPSQDPTDTLITFNLVSAGYDGATIWTNDVTLVATKNGYELTLWWMVARTNVGTATKENGGELRPPTEVPAEEMALEIDREKCRRIMGAH